jgi:hypothetical protein
MLSKGSPIPNLLIGVPVESVEKVVDLKENNIRSFKQYLHNHLLKQYENSIEYKYGIYIIKNLICIILVYINSVYTIQVFADSSISFLELQQLREFLLNLIQ